MDYYSFDEIRQVADCRELARELFGAEVKGERCAATWRGGKNPESVKLSKDEFFDHGKGQGGGALQLVALKFNGNIQAAQDFLGKHYNLKPKLKMQKNPIPSRNRYTSLIVEGYKEVARYEYKDLDGKVQHFTVRMEREGRKKEFVQGHYGKDNEIVWSLDGVNTVLYRLPEIDLSTWVVLCEGEKSANTLASSGLPSTTAPMGSGHWKDSYVELLAGKSVVICPDNDDPGRHHADIVARSLYGKAKLVCIIEPDESLPPKAGIDDWFNAGHTKDEFMERVKDAPVWKPLDIKDDCPEQIHSVSPKALKAAAKANAIPFRNYIPVKTEKPNVKGKTVQTIEKEPRQPQDMIDDVFKRFLGFPRKVGESILFDHDRDTHKIKYLHNEHYLFAWMGRKSKKVPDWATGTAFLPKKEMYINIESEAQQYESIARSPSWPMREDVYYAHPPLPPPTKTRKYLAEFTDMFCPSSDNDYTLIMSLICAPLWYIPGLPRPSYIIDSPHGHGVGKSTIIEMVADLYDTIPIVTTQYELRNDPERIKRRLLSQKGRDARLFLVDNVEGDWSSIDFSSLVSAPRITGMAPFGRGEESRPNDLLYTVTANSAKVASEIADRSIYIFVNRPSDQKSHDSWKLKIMNYIKKYRYNIISDILDMLKTHKPFYDVKLRTRFREFESRILHACCGTPEHAEEIIAHIVHTRAESSSEDEKASVFREVFNDAIADLLIKPGVPCFLSTSILNSWGRIALNSLGDNSKEKPLQMLMNIAKINLLPELNINVRRVQRWHKEKNLSVRGLGWNMPNQHVGFWNITKKHEQAASAEWIDGPES